MNSKSDLTPARDINTLLAIMEKLRSPDGCPWDKEQTFQSLVPYTLEEAYEVTDAVMGGQGYKICEELGDLLLQIVFFAQIATESGEFDFGDVVYSITGKLIRRHPHIFGDDCASSPKDVEKLWESVKEQEGSEPAAPPLPSLLVLQKLVSKGKIDSQATEDSILSKLIALVETAAKEGRCLEAEIKRFCANFWLK